MAQVARAQTEAVGGPEHLKRLSVQFRGMGVPEQEVLVTGFVREAADGRATIDTVAKQDGKQIIRNAEAEITILRAFGAEGPGALGGSGTRSLQSQPCSPPGRSGSSATSSTAISAAASPSPRRSSPLTPHLTAGPPRYATSWRCWRSQGCSTIRIPPRVAYPPMPATAMWSIECSVPVRACCLRRAWTYRSPARRLRTRCARPRIPFAGHQPARGHLRAFGQHGHYPPCRGLGPAAAHGDGGHHHLTGGVSKVLATLDGPIDPGLLAWAGEYLNERLVGLNLGARMLHQRLIDAGLPATERAFLDRLAPAIGASGSDAEDTLYVEGASRLFSADNHLAEVTEINELMGLLERRVALLDVLRAALSKPGVYVRIGHENPNPAMRSLALVASGYGVARRRLGTVSVIGPVRMDYAQAIPTVREAAFELSRFVEDAYGEN